MSSISILDQLVRIYFNEEDWHVNRFSEEKAKEYYQRLLSNGNIVFACNYKEIIGYCDYFILNEQQLEKVSNKELFPDEIQHDENGEYCFCSTIWIKKECRNEEVLWTLKKQIERRWKFKWYAGFRMKKDKFLLMEKKYGCR